MALVACPTGSIGTLERHDAHIGIDAFPLLLADNVYFCGFTSESSFGAWSYLIVRPSSEGGNVLVDSPRFATQLLKRIDALGGVNQMLLTHKDDVADHELFRKRFECERVMHAGDAPLVLASNKSSAVRNQYNWTMMCSSFPCRVIHAVTWSTFTATSFSSRAITWHGRRRDKR